jgi:hypothetical protein
LNVNAWLVVRVRREDLGFLDRNCCTPLDQGRHDTASRLNTQRKRRNIKQQHIFRGFGSITTQNPTLDSSTIGLEEESSEQSIK